MASRQRPSSLTRRDLIRNAALGAGALAISNGLLTGCDGGRTVRSDEKSTSFESAYLSRSIQIVGTAGPTVMPSSRIKALTNAVSMRRPGMTSLLPNMGPRKGMPQPLQ